MKNLSNSAYFVLVLILTIAIPNIAQDNSNIDTILIKKEITKLEKNIEDIDFRISTFSQRDKIFLDGMFSHTRYGVFISPLIFNHNANFMMLDSFKYISCIQEEYGIQFNFGYYAGISFDYNFSRWFGAGIKIGFGQINNLLISNESLAYNHNGDLKYGNIAHTISFKNHFVIAEPTLHFWISNKVFANVSGRFANLIGKEFEQKETLEKVEPTYSFNNGSKERNIIRGEIPGLNSFQYGFQLGAGYEIPLNKTGTMLFVPELRAGINLSKFSSNLDWKTNQAVIYLSLKYSPQPTRDSIPLERREEIRINDSLQLLAERQTIVNKIKELENEIIKARLQAGLKELLSARITKISYTSEDRELNSIRVEQVKTLRIIPLLNMIFFESNSSEIPTRYKLIEPNERIGFSEEKVALSSEPMEIYYNLLNLVGRRMTENPNANITLIACTDSKEAKQKESELASLRAEAISYYLQNVWKIAGKRISIKTRNLPEKFTAGDDEFVHSENRRIEIISDNNEILAPIIAYNFISSEIIPSKLVTYFDVKAGQGIKQWNVRLQSESGEETVFNLDNSIPIVPPYIEWDLTKNQQLVSNEASSRLVFELMVQDNAGQQNFDTKGIQVVFAPSINRKLISNTDYNLLEFRILLPFDDPGLTEENQRLMKFIMDYIRKLNWDNTQMFINGFTDSMGTTERNLALSNQRAKKVFDFLGQSRAFYEGKGVSYEFNNSLPEGRFYNRSVKITVQPK